MPSQAMYGTSITIEPLKLIDIRGVGFKDIYK